MSDGADPNLLQQLGLKVPELAAGASGGIVQSFLFKQSAAISILGNIIVGALMANYVADVVSRLVGTPLPLTAFGVGVGGMALAQILYDRVLSTAGKLKTPEATDGPDHPSA